MKITTSSATATGSTICAPPSSSPLEAIEPVKPLWLEDPLPPDFSDTWVKLRAGSKVPIGTGENLARRHGFKDYIIQQGCDIVQLDIRNTGGLLESKRIADLADLVLPADGRARYGQRDLQHRDGPLGSFGA